LLFVVGINSAQRISDLLELQVGQFLDEDLHIKPRFWIKEQKRGKRQEVVVNTSIRETLEEYFSAYPELIGDQYNYVFFNTKANGFMQPIRRARPGRSFPILPTGGFVWQLRYTQFAKNMGIPRSYARC
jgi:integrase